MTARRRMVPDGAVNPRIFRIAASGFWQAGLCERGICRMPEANPERAVLT